MALPKIINDVIYVMLDAYIDELCNWLHDNKIDSALVPIAYMPKIINDVIYVMQHVPSSQGGILKEGNRPVKRIARYPLLKAPSESLASYMRTNENWGLMGVQPND